MMYHILKRQKINDWMRAKKANPNFVWKSVFDLTRPVLSNWWLIACANMANHEILFFDLKKATHRKVSKLEHGYYHIEQPFRFHIFSSWFNPLLLFLSNFVQTSFAKGSCFY